MKREKEKTIYELRQFALIVGVGFGVIATLLLWKSRSTSGGTLLTVSGLLFVFGLIFPKSLRPLERLWMRFAHYLGTIMTFVILVLSFYLVITPMAFLMRLARRDPLNRKFDRKAKSYWIPVEPDAPGTRPFLPY